MRASHGDDGSGQPVSTDESPSGQLKAFIASVEGFSEVYIPARTAGKARYIAVKGLREAGYTDSAQFRNVRIKHAKEYDAWAQRAEVKYYSFNQMLDSARSMNL